MPRMPDNADHSIDLRWAWPSVELPGYRPYSRHATYEDYAYSNLPPVPSHLDPEFEWLRAHPAVPRSLAESSHLDSPVLGVLRDGMQVPVSFKRFLESLEPQRRVRSCTDCFIELGDFVAETEDGGRLVHFLSDSQWSLHWLLYLGDREAILATSSPLCFAEDDDSPREFADPTVPVDLQRTDAALCAETFSEFVYRFWIENEIWFALEMGDGALTDEQQRYAEHYR